MLGGREGLDPDSHVRITLETERRYFDRGSHVGQPRVGDGNEHLSLPLIFSLPSLLGDAEPRAARDHKSSDLLIELSVAPSPFVPALDATCDTMRTQEGLDVFPPLDFESVWGIRVLPAQLDAE